MVVLAPQYGAVRKASIALHQALGEAWSCANSEHIEHTTKLCLDAKADDNVRLDLAISYRKRVERQVSSYV